MKIASLLVALLLITPLAHAAQSPDDAARFLAGLPVRDPALASIASQPASADHAAQIGRSWDRMEQRQMTKVRAWAATDLPAASRSTAPVFYFFSGPDFLYAHALFPNSANYILCGTEPVGSVPDITQIPRETLAGDLNNLRVSLSTMLTTHYFITKDMRVDLARGQIVGTLPILYVFLARTGCTIRSVKTSATNAEITFTGPAGQLQTLNYFKTDLSNGGGHGAFLAYCKKQAPGLSLVKSASYLMHTDGFSEARNFLLANSRLLVQDDSGIPLRSLDPKRWTLRFYGNYEGPIELFKQYHQPDLLDIYQRSNPPALGFAFGYAWQPSKGALLVAVPR
jgi:hypothetical protein